MSTRRSVCGSGLAGRRLRCLRVAEDGATAQEDEPEADLGTHVENHEAERLDGKRDETGTLGSDDPQNRVGGPEDQGQHGQRVERALNVSRALLRRTAETRGEEVQHDDHRDGADEPPGVPRERRLRQSADEAGDDHQRVDADERPDGSPIDLREKREVEQQQRRREQPVSVPGIINVERSAAGDLDFGQADAEEHRQVRGRRNTRHQDRNRVVLAGLFIGDAPPLDKEVEGPDEHQ